MRGKTNTLGLLERYMRKNKLFDAQPTMRFRVQKPAMKGIWCLSYTNNPRSQDLSTSLPMELRDIAEEITQHG